MPKNIVVCSDGTGNANIKDRGTNVFKLYEAVDLHDATRQVAMYDDGVGTDSGKILKVLGGAFGYGLSRNVRQLYTEIARVYKPGDHIYLFGFSRGAYTVRTLAGFIHDCGIINNRHPEIPDDLALQHCVNAAYKLYRRKYWAVMTWVWHAFVGWWFNRLTCWLFKGACCGITNSDDFRSKYGVDVADDEDKRPPIHFIGVWDTVSAVGMPFHGLKVVSNFLFYRFEFNDLHLCKRVHKACHALAMDDERLTFHPTMWDEENETTNRIEQVWFAGVHSNVGGGYPKQGMSLVPLDWMMKKATAEGLLLHASDADWYEEHRNINDKLYDSRAGLAMYYRYLPRDIAAICRDNHIQTKVHSSVIHRITTHTEGYAPGNFPAEFLFVSDKGADDWLAPVAERIKQAHAGSSSLIDKLRWLVIWRHYTHIVFLALTAAALWLTFAQDGVLNNITEKSYLDIALLLLNTLLKKPWLLGVFLISFFMTRALGMSMRRQFSRFWSRLIPELEKAKRQ